MVAPPVDKTRRRRGDAAVITCGVFMHFPFQTLNAHAFALRGTGAPPDFGGGDGSPSPLHAGERGWRRTFSTSTNPSPLYSGERGWGEGENSSGDLNPLTPDPSPPSTGERGEQSKIERGTREEQPADRSDLDPTWRRRYRQPSWSVLRGRPSRGARRRLRHDGRTNSLFSWLWRRCCALAGCQRLVRTKLSGAGLRQQLAAPRPRAALLRSGVAITPCSRAPRRRRPGTAPLSGRWGPHAMTF